MGIIITQDWPFPDRAVSMAEIQARFEAELGWRPHRQNIKRWREYGVLDEVDYAACPPVVIDDEITVSRGTPTYYYRNDQVSELLFQFKMGTFRYGKIEGGSNRYDREEILGRIEGIEG
ncbi:MAG TPA: hypothetical protein PLB32_13580 [Acidobacteriota bacterium]|nr:hypothetical protein [Acidobacteriota bacterium]